jgi:hypothetical protein
MHREGAKPQTLVSDIIKEIFYVDHGFALR